MKERKRLHIPEKNEVAIKMMCDSAIQFSALLSVPLGNGVTVTTYDNLASIYILCLLTFYLSIT